MATASFRPQDAVWGYGWPTAAQATLSEWIPADAIDRFAVRYDEIALTSTPSRADVSSAMTGLVGEVQGPQTAIEHSGPITVPLGPDTFNLGLLALHAGAAKDEAQLGSDTAYQQQISPDETDVDLTGRYITAEQDIRDGEPRIWNPVGIPQVVWNFAKGDIVKMQYTPLPLYVRYYDLAVLETGSPTNKAIIRGWLNPTQNAIADKKLYLKVTAYGSPTATMLAGFAATPTGSVTFSVTAGKDAEGQPYWTEIVDGDGLTQGVPIGRADNKMEIALLDAADVTALDEISLLNPIPDPVVTRPTTPTFTVSAICLTVDGTRVADLESATLTTVNDLQAVPGGACGAQPQAFNREGASTAEFTFERRFVTFRHEKDIHDDAEFAVLIEGRTDVLVDSGGARGDVFDFSVSLPLGRYASGFKALASATDSTSSYTVRASPDASNAQWTVLMKTAFADIFA